MNDRPDTHEQINNVVLPVRLSSKMWAVAWLGMAVGGLVLSLLLADNKLEDLWIFALSAVSFSGGVALVILVGKAVGSREFEPQIAPTDVKIATVRSVVWSVARRVPLQLAIVLIGVIFTGPIMPGLAAGASILSVASGVWVARWERDNSAMIVRAGIGRRGSTRLRAVHK